MKNFKITCYFVALLFLASCKKTDTTSSDSTILNSDEAAVSVGTSLSSNGYGLNSQIMDAIPLSVSGSLATSQTTNHNSLSVLGANHLSYTSPACGFTKDTTITRDNSNNPKGLVQYSFQLHYNFKVVCDGNYPTSMIFIDSTTGSYSGLRVNFNGSSNSEFVLTNIQPKDSALVLNGTFVRNGSFQSKLRSNATFSSVITLNVTGLTVGKTSHFISAGTGTITFTGSSSAGKTYSYTGTVDFSNANKIVLLLEGKKHLYDLITGEELTIQ